MNASAHILSEAPVPADGLLPRLAEDASVRELMRPLAGLLADPALTELVINRPQRVLTETHLGWQAHDCADLDFERLMSFAVAIATLTNQEVSARHPVLSALLPGDARVQIVIPPVVPPRTVSVTIRRPSSREKTLDATATRACSRRPRGTARLDSMRQCRHCVNWIVISPGASKRASSLRSSSGRCAAG